MRISDWSSDLCSSDLVWCRDRLHELESRPSLLNPLWYAGSFSLGVLAGRAGVGKNLGFMAETERQVEQHLEGHLRSEEHTSELQSLMRISYAVFCLKKKKQTTDINKTQKTQTT